MNSTDTTGVEKNDNDDINSIDIDDVSSVIDDDNGNDYNWNNTTSNGNNTESTTRGKMDDIDQKDEYENNVERMQLKPMNANEDVNNWDDILNRITIRSSLGRYCQFCTTNNTETDQEDYYDLDGQQQQQKPSLSTFFCRYVTGTETENNLTTAEEELSMINYLFSNPDIVQQSYMQLLQLQSRQQQQQDNVNESGNDFHQVESRDAQHQQPVEHKNDDEIGHTDDDYDYYYKQGRLLDYYEANSYRTSLESSIVLFVSRIRPLLTSFNATIHQSYSQMISMVTNLYPPISLDFLNPTYNNEMDDEVSVPISTSTKLIRQNKQRVGLGHTERILGCDISYCGNYLATASQDSTIRIWKVSTNALLSTIKFDTEHELLRVTWSSPFWLLQTTTEPTQPTPVTSTSSMSTTPNTDINDVDHSQNNVLSKSSLSHSNHQNFRQQYPYIIAIGGADGIVHLYGTNHPEQHQQAQAQTSNWLCLTQLDHTAFAPNYNNSTGNNESPQIYSLQFIDTWIHNNIHLDNVNDDVNTITPLISARSNMNNNCNRRSSSVLITSSDDHVHIWEAIIINDHTTINSPTDSTTVTGRDDGYVDDDSLRSRKKLKLNTNGDVVDTSDSRSSLSQQQQHLIFQELYSIQFTAIGQDNDDDNNNQQYDGNKFMSIRFVTSKNDASKDTCNSIGSSYDGVTNNNDKTLGRTNNTPFGGHRNPNNINYVFDTSYCTVNGILGIALSDGTVRLIQAMTGMCCFVIVPPPYIYNQSQSHITSLAWNSTGTQLATCLGNAKLLTWSVTIGGILSSSPPSSSSTTTQTNVENQVLTVDDQPRLTHKHEQLQLLVSWKASFEGGHKTMVPLYGAKYLRLYNNNKQNSNRMSDDIDGTSTVITSDEYLISWSSAGSICVWDCYQQGECNAPLSILFNQPDYPIYAVSIGSLTDSTNSRHDDINKQTISNGCDNIGSTNQMCSTTEQTSFTVAIVGGGTTPGFIGIPVYFYNVE